MDILQVLTNTLAIEHEATIPLAGADARSKPSPYNSEILSWSNQKVQVAQKRRDKAKPSLQYSGSDKGIILLLFAWLLTIAIVLI